jgi:hydrogenase maturation protease
MSESAATADVLVAGVGNVFFGDDGFGIEVVRRLAAGPPLPGVEVADYGIRGLHLAYRMLDPLRLLVVVDATLRGGAPGTLYVLDPETEEDLDRGVSEGHGMELGAVFAAVRAMGGSLPAVRVVGCEPGEIVERMGLGPAVERAVPGAVALVCELATGRPPATAPEGTREEARR